MQIYMNQVVKVLTPCSPSIQLIGLKSDSPFPVASSIEGGLHCTVRLRKVYPKQIRNQQLPIDG